MSQTILEANPDLVILKDIFGYGITVLLSLLYIPQTIWVFYRRNPHGMTWIFLILGMLLASDSIGYGILLEELPLVLANSIVLVCMICISIVKFIWRNEDPNKEQQSNP